MLFQWTLDLNGLKSISEETLKTDCGVNNRPYVAPKVSKEAKWIRLWYSKGVLSKIIGF